MLTIRRPGRGRASRATGRVQFDTKDDLLAGGAAVQAGDYARASNNRRGASESVPTQLTNNANEIRSRQWTHAASFADDNVSGGRDSSGKLKKREDFDALMATIRSGKLHVLVMRDVQRQQRDLAVYAEIRDACIQHGLFFWFVRGTLYDLRQPADRLNLGITAVFGEFQRDSTKSSSYETITENIKAGRPHGKAPFGFFREYDPHSRKSLGQKLDETLRKTERGESWSAAGVVRKLYADLLSGKTLMQLASDLNERGIPAPRLAAALYYGTPLAAERWAHTRWAEKTIRDLLINPAMIGQLYFDGELRTSGTWERIVDDATFYTAYALLTDPKRLSRSDDGESWRAEGGKYLLAGLAHCGVCGRSMTGLKANPKYRTANATYKCRSSRGCAAVPMREADAHVERWVLTWLTRGGRLDELAAEAAGSDSERVAASARAAALRIQLEEWRAQLDDPTIEVPAASFARRERALEAAIEAAEAEALPAGLSPRLRQFVGKDAREVAALWHGMSLAAQRELIAEVVTITVNPTGKGRRFVPVDDGHRLVIAARI